MARKNWNDHLSDFNLDDSGDYNYRGAFYAIIDSEQVGGNEYGENESSNLSQLEETLPTRSVSLMGILVVALLILLFTVLCGVFPATGATDTWYVILPFGLTIALSGVLVYHIFRLFRAFYSKEASSISGLLPENAAEQNAIFDKNGIGLVREYVFIKTWPRFSPLTKAVMILSIITIFTESIHLVMKGRGAHFGGAVLLLICMVLTALLSLVLLRRYNEVKWQRMSKNSGF